MQPHQHLFHHAQAHIKLALWGIGGGKTQTIMYEHLVRSLAKPGLDSAIIAQTGPLLHRIAEKKIKELGRAFKKAHGLPLIAHWHKTDKVFTLINGHRIFLIPSDDPEKLQGTEFTHVSIDEAGIIKHQQEVFEELIRRCRIYSDWVILMATSFIPDSWIIRHVKEQVRLQNQEGYTGPLDYWLDRRDSFANKLVLVENLDLMKRSMSDMAYRASVLSDDTVSFNALVFGSAFHPERSMSPFSPGMITPREFGGFEMYCGVDWGKQFGHMITVVRDVQKDLDYIVDDLPLDVGGYDFQVKAITDRIAYNQARWRLLPRFIQTDPTGQLYNQKLRKALQHLGITVRYTFAPTDRDINVSIEQVRERLLNAAGERRLFVTKECASLPWNQPNQRGVLPSFEGYRYYKTPDGEIIGKAFDDQKHTHSMDALRYVNSAITVKKARIRIY
jgi:hypothetical protein